MILVDVHDLVVTNPLSFLLGLLVGLIVKSRYRIIRRNGKEG